MKTAQEMLKKMTMSLGRGLALALLLAPIGVFGDGFLDDDLYYSFESGSTTQVYVNGLRNSSATHITIPATVVYEYYDYNDYDEDEGHYRIKRRTCTVTRIPENAFYDNTSIKSVTVKSGMTSIADGAFACCWGLTSISIPSSVTSIGSRAFGGCRSLANVTIPSSVTSIGGSAFYNCSSLASVTIPSSVTSIGYSAFSGCSSLAAVHITDVASWCGISFDNLYANPLYYANNLYLNDSLVTDLVIPDGVASIDNYAFYNCTSLTSVTIEDGLTSIGNCAFYNCTSLDSVAIPSSVTSIGDNYYTFYDCGNISTATMPEYVMARGLGVVCKNLTKLRNLHLLADVKTIGVSQFYNCKSLTTIEVDAENEHYFVSPMDGCLYDINQTTLLCCPRDKTSITIPYGVTKIANYAFAYCSNLVSVTMPVTVTTIGENAFLDCASLPTAAIPDSVSSIGNNAFGNCRKLSGVTIPSSVKALSTSAFNNCDILWTEWYRTLADFAVNGRAYDLTQTPSDRAIADVSVSGDTALDAFVLKEGKVYDSVLYIHNNAGHSVRVTLPSMPQTSYQTFKGASPLTLPAYSTSILTITRVAGGNAGGNVFLVTREELETIQ